ncbi:hypothetical protein G7074_15770 [Pedobacter sp. HDW13]|uniref:hypothetical protein n=1 Tax=Pedobacter sp. HDW13 TaxID=2714940 RepID=UPI00140C3E8F|nr:hypothetical protein [Pedobacter sp. HDW13]QIL40595.1 hypothetical protein G7074_15770 [Pedobacter sp. HDW13]
MIKKALHNQSVLDFVLHHTGSIVAALDFSFDAAIAITDDLLVGNSYPVSGNLLADTDILNYYTSNNYTPATATLIDTDYGIGEMRILSTFIVR